MWVGEDIITQSLVHVCSWVLLQCIYTGRVYIATLQAILLTIQLHAYTICIYLYNYDVNILSCCWCRYGMAHVCFSQERYRLAEVYIRKALAVNKCSAICCTQLALVRHAHTHVHIQSRRQTIHTCTHMSTYKQMHAHMHIQCTYIQTHKIDLGPFKCNS